MMIDEKKIVFMRLFTITKIDSFFNTVVLMAHQNCPALFEKDDSYYYNTYYTRIHPIHTSAQNRPFDSIALLCGSLKRFDWW